MFDTSLEIVSFVISWITTIITIACYLPQTIKTFVTKNTADLSAWFIYFGIGCSIGWSISAIVSLFVYLEADTSISDALLLSLPVLATNIVGLVCNLILLVIKMKNIKEAKKLSITEKEYCDQKNKDKKDKLTKL